VYIIEVNDDIDYINFNDELYQIILHPGLRITVTNVLVIGGVKYNLCKVYNTPKEYMEILYNNIFEGGRTNKLYNIKNFKIHEGKSKYPQVIAKASGPSEPSVHTYICLGSQVNEDITPNTYFNVKYTLHQHFICDCYKFFNINVVDYAIYYDNDNDKGSFYTGYVNDVNYEPINTRSREYGRFNYNFDNLFIDSLLHNDDVLYPQNYMKNVRRRFDYRLNTFRSVGLFDYEGYKKVNFNIHEPSRIYVDILREYISRDEDRNNLYINDITRDYMKMIISNNINDLKEFRDVFVDMLRDSYIDFINVNMKIDNTTEEYSDLVTMFSELTECLKKTADYYVKNMEDGTIYKEVEPFIYAAKDMTVATVGGKQSTLNRRQAIVYTKSAKAANAVASDTKATKATNAAHAANAANAANTDNIYNNNKGYVMPYEDFLKVINKYNSYKI
jgi:hypothetical protein